MEIFKGGAKKVVGMTNTKRVVDEGGSRRESTTFSVDRSLIDDAVSLARTMRRSRGQRVTQSDIIEDGVRLWLKEHGAPGYVEYEEGEIEGQCAKYPAHLKPLIDELLHVLYDEPVGGTHRYVQYILKEAIQMLREGKYDL